MGDPLATAATSEWLGALVRRMRGLRRPTTPPTSDIPFAGFSTGSGIAACFCPSRPALQRALLCFAYLRPEGGSDSGIVQSTRPFRKTPWALHSADTFYGRP